MLFIEIEHLCLTDYCNDLQATFKYIKEELFCPINAVLKIEDQFIEKDISDFTTLKFGIWLQSLQEEFNK